MFFPFIPSVIVLAVAFGVNLVSSPTLGRIGAEHERITKQDLDLYMYQRLDLRGKIADPQGRRDAFDEMVLARLLTLEGQRRAVPFAPKRPLERFDDVYALQALREISDRCTAKPTEPELRKFYDEHPTKFQVPASIRLWRIKVPKGAEHNSIQADQFAKDTYEALRTNKMSPSEAVEAAADYHSLEPQGDLGWVGDDGSEYFLRLYAASLDEYLPPQLIDDNYYLFLVSAKTPADPIPWATAKTGLVEKTYLGDCRRNEKRQVLKQLSTQYQFEPVGSVE